MLVEDLACIVLPRQKMGHGLKSAGIGHWPPGTTSQLMCKLILEVKKEHPTLALIVTIRRIKWFLILRIPLTPHMSVNGERD